MNSQPLSDMDAPKTIKVRLPLRPIDLPPGSLLIHEQWKEVPGVMAMVLSTSKEGITIAMKGQIAYLSYQCLMDDGTEYAKDGSKPFEKCERWIEVFESTMEL